jgi:hypothetical protein
MVEPDVLRSGAEACSNRDGTSARKKNRFGAWKLNKDEVRTIERSGEAPDNVPAARRRYKKPFNREANLLLDFADLHVLVDGEDRIADR